MRVKSMISYDSAVVVWLIVIIWIFKQTELKLQEEHATFPHL